MRVIRRTSLLPREPDSAIITVGDRIQEVDNAIYRLEATRQLSDDQRQQLNNLRREKDDLNRRIPGELWQKKV